MTKKARASSKNIGSFKAMKESGSKISMITAYDYPTARSVANTDIDLILVGDSLGMVVLGYDNTLQVTVEEMIHHSAAVRRGAPDAFIVIDMPFMSYHISPENTKANAARLLLDGKANAVKLEGGSPSRIEMIRQIVDCEIPVCAHLGLTPQSVHRFGGYKVQGKTPEAYQKIMDEALEVEAAGAFMLVLEGIPELLGKEISAKLKIPTIGIGAGRFTDGQVLVMHDLLGYTDPLAKFAKAYGDLGQRLPAIISDYDREVKEGLFPSRQHCYYPIDTDTQDH